MLPNKPVKSEGAADGTVYGVEVASAARWYANNRDSLTGAFFPELRHRFGLTPLQAIEAGKLAHKIEQGGDNAQP